MARTKKPDFAEVQAAPYPHVVRLYQDEVLYIEALEAEGIDTSDGFIENCFGVECASGLNVLVFIRPGRTKFDRSITLMHELLHATFDVLKDVGIDPTSNNGEVSTYLQGYLYESLIHEL